MSETHTITRSFNGHIVSYEMYLDPTYIPDAILDQYPADQLEPEAISFVIRTLREGDVAVDAGANIGYFTLLMSKLVGPTGLVHAVEPHPDTCARLKRNIALNDTGNVAVREFALWDCRRDLTLYTCFEPGLASLRPYDGWTGSRTVRTERLDSIVPVAPRLMKMDVEGSELTALQGASWIGDCPYVLCELSRQNLGHHSTTPEAVAAFMYGHGKHLWMLDKEGKIEKHPVGATLPDGPVNRMYLFASEKDVEEVLHGP